MREIYRCKMVVSSHKDIDNQVELGCISWSAKNMLVMSAHNTFQHNHSHLLWIDPNVPNQYTKITTEHTAPVHVMDWSLVTCSNLLLSVDDQSSLCIWKSKDSCVNDYVLVTRFHMEGVVSAKWLHSEKKYLSPKTDQSGDSIEARYTAGTVLISSIPNGMNAFLTICKNGQVHFCFMDLARAQWISSSVHLNMDDIAVADFAIKPDGQIIIACAGSNRFAVHIFHCSLKKTAAITESNVPAPRIQLTLEEHTVFTLAAPTELNIDSYQDAGIKKLQFLPYKVDAQELLIISNNNEIQRWICTPAPVYVSSVLCAVSSTQDGLPLHSQPTDQVEETNTATQERPLWLQANRIYFENQVISTSECSKDGLYYYIGFTDGRIQQYQLSDLSLVSEVGVPQAHNTTPDKEDGSIEPPQKRLKMHNNPTNAKILSIAISPNHSCIVAIDAEHVLHLYSIFPQQEGVSWLKAKFELSFLNYTDVWDLLVIVWKHLDHDQTDAFIKELEKAKQKLSIQNRHYYSLPYERIYALLFRLLGGRKLTPMVSTQAKIFLSSTFNIIRSFETYKSETGVTDPLQLLQNYERHFIERVTNDPGLKKQYLTLIPLTNWVCQYIILLARDIEVFCERMNRAYQVRQKIPSLSNFYALQNLKVIQIVAYLRDSLMYMYGFMHLYYDSNGAAVDEESISSAPPMFNKEQIKSLFIFICDIYKHAEGFIGKPIAKEQMDILYHKKNVQVLDEIMKAHATNLHSLLPLHDRIQLLDDLDLILQFQGVLSGEYWQRDNLNENLNDLPHSKKYDIVTRNEVHPDGHYKICKTCSRMTTVSLKGWATRFVSACMMCGGSYKSLPLV